MVHQLHRALLISPGDVMPSDDSLEVIGSFNPGVIEHNGEVVLLVRIAERPRQRRAGFTALPRWEDGRVVTDWISIEEVDSPDARVVRRKEDGLLRLTYTSHLRVFTSSDGRSIDGWAGARLIPGEVYEVYGLEDPRVVFIDGVYWITYVAVSNHGAATALMSTSDFVSFDRHGIIFCPENKDVVIFPEQIDGKFVALNRPTAAHPFCRPEMWIARSPDLLDWGSHQPLHGSRSLWESDRVGGGTPPIRTERGWLEIYHACRRTEAPGEVGTYSPGAMLLDISDPSRVIWSTNDPLWEPETDYELSGFVPRVVFPTGIIERDDIVQLFFGAADTCTAMVELPLPEIISASTG